VISITLPYPPSSNTMFPTAGGRRVLSEAAKSYRERVIWTIRSQVPAAARQSWPLAGQMRLRLDVQPPDQRRRDISNTIKAIEDAITAAGLWFDDAQVAELVVVRGTVTPGGSVRVEVSEL
jgi:crossover junction endodeoxyribonuclease RusA